MLGEGVDLTLLRGPARPVLLGDHPPPGKGCAPCGCLCRDEGLGHRPGAWRLSLTAQTCLSRDAGRRRLALRTRGLGREAAGSRPDEQEGALQSLESCPGPRHGGPLLPRLREVGHTGSSGHPVCFSLGAELGHLGLDSAAAPTPPGSSNF